MSTYMSMLFLVGAGILVVALFYTWSLAKGQKRTKGNLDADIPNPVQEHAYIRNPVFLTYLIMFVLSFLLIIYFTVTIYK